MTTFVELCCGLASVSLSLFGLKPPVSRIGAKTGYADAIRERLGVSEAVATIVLVDRDAGVCNVLHELLCSTLSDERKLLAALESYVDLSPSLARSRASNFRFVLGPHGAAAWLMWTASSRGGIGGFKGKHKLRPNVDGFIPSRGALTDRVRKLVHQAAMRTWFSNGVRVVCADAASVRPEGGATVYIDPPYDGTQGYDETLSGGLRDLAERWAGVGCTVGVSERRRLPWKGWKAYNITNERKGQCRRSMTRSVQEWLMVRNGEVSG